MLRRLLPVVLTTLIVLFSVAGGAVAQPAFAGHWEGGIDVLGGRLTIIVYLTADAGTFKGTIDVPQQGGKGLQLTNLRVEAPRIHFEFPAGAGAAVFDGELKNRSR